MKAEKSKKSGKVKSPFFCYKGKPLVRSKDILYYGKVEDGCVVKIEVESTKKLKDLRISQKVLVKLIDTDPSVTEKEKVVKFSEKQGLYQALDVGEAWLEWYYREMQKTNI